MARSRLLKPGFFTNELLAELPFEGRLLFAGLWLLADRDGRLEERVGRIKAAVFPYDVVDVASLLVALETKGFIERYTVNAMRLIQVAKFDDHQTPHHREPASTLPAPPGRVAQAEPDNSRCSPAVTGNGSSSVTGNGSLCSTPSAEPPVHQFPTAGRPNLWPLTKGLIDDWQELYPALDIEAECRSAYAWVLANPGRKKTAKGMPAFLVGWFTRSNDRRRGPDRRDEPRQSAERRAYDEWRAAGGCAHSPQCSNFTTCQVVAARTSA